MSKPCIKEDCVSKEIPLCKYCPHSIYRSKETELRMEGGEGNED